jgi:hypothetical protein
MGGLGNQLFQIFTTISYAIKTRNMFSFYNADFTGGIIKRDTYWGNLLSKLKPFLKKEFPLLHIIKETEFGFTEIPLTNFINKNVCLHGYFQSYKYFQSTYATIYRLLNIDSHKDTIKNKNTSLGVDIDYNNTISIHFRLGDYAKMQHIHPIIPYKYYQNALTYIVENAKDTKYNRVLFFCEEDDLSDVTITINKLKEYFKQITFERGSSELKDWEQMLLMSCCKYNIIANSSFSWWGAYLNTNIDKVVCYPSLWFGPSMSHNTSDLFPDEWVKIQI